MDSDVMIISETVPEIVIISSDDEDSQGNERNRPLGLRKATKRKDEIEEEVNLRRVKTEKHGTEATTSKRESSCFNSQLYQKLRRVMNSEKSDTPSDKINLSTNVEPSTSARYSDKTERYSAKIKSLFDSSPKKRDRRDSSSRERELSHRDPRSSRNSETSKKHSTNHKRSSSSKNDKSDTSFKDRSKRDTSTGRYESISSTNDKKKRKYSTETQTSRSTKTPRENYKKKFEDAVSNNDIIKSKINDTIANDWSSILENGLPDIVKEALLKNQTIPANCPLLKAPTLNLEILDHVTKRHHKRDMDTARMEKQNQLGLGITAVGKGLSLLAEDHRNGNTVIEACRFIQQGCKILTDLHYVETNARKEALNLKPPMSALLTYERDDTLLSRGVSSYLRSFRFSNGSQATNTYSASDECE